ncbi:hypothetical protein ACI2KR_08125 [Pseudomonas luteola]
MSINFDLEKSFGPRKSEGNLYYVKLNTPLGIFYKIGYTSLGSVEERLAYQDTGDEKMIDKVLLFHNMKDAYQTETRLHSHFRRSAAFGQYSAQKDMPLCNNGQSELYYKDVLELDDNYDKRQMWKTRFNVYIQTEKRKTASLTLIYAQLALTLAFIGILCAVFWPLAKLGKLALSQYHNFTGTKQKEDHALTERRTTQELIEWAQEAKCNDDKARRIKRKKALHKLEIESEIRMALKAVTEKDYKAFSEKVDVPFLAESAFKSQIEKFITISDFMGIANNCSMINLMNAMSRSNASSYDLIAAPVLTTYEKVIFELVTSHDFLQKELLIPDDPLYEIGDFGFEPIPLSLYFGPEEILSPLGSIEFLTNPDFSWKDKIVTFSFAVSNAETNFSGLLTFSADTSESGPLRLSIPGLKDLVDNARAAKKIKASA